MIVDDADRAPTVEQSARVGDAQRQDVADGQIRLDGKL